MLLQEHVGVERLTQTLARVICSHHRPHMDHMKQPIASWYIVYILDQNLEQTNTGLTFSSGHLLYQLCAVLMDSRLSLS